jgi:hypothetical protein
LTHFSFHTSDISIKMMHTETNHLPETSNDEDVLTGLLGDRAGADDNAAIRSESSNSTGGDDNDAVDTTSETKSLSSTSLEALPNESPRRSIFSKHWKATNPSSPYGQSDPTVQRSKSPKCVLRHPHFGLYGQHETKEDEEVSVNMYERSLENCETSRRVREERDRKHWRPYESRPLASWFSSLPTLVLSESLLPRSTQSDIALHKNRLLKPVLRKGRFSGTKTTIDESNKNSHVSFESVIQVHSFERPMDQWAERGWSSWFGL